MFAAMVEVRDGDKAARLRAELKYEDDGIEVDRFAAGRRIDLIVESLPGTSSFEFLRALPTVAIRSASRHSTSVIS